MLHIVAFMLDAEVAEMIPNSPAGREKISNSVWFNVAKTEFPYRFV
jgi:hypothetical protein